MVLFDVGYIQDNKAATGDRWVGKVNFVEIRSFWHIFRSFDRMWSFFILCLQVPISTSMHFICQVILLRLQICEMVLILASFYKAMIIVAWNGTGELSSVFSSDVFKKVLSVFITAAILKLGQGR
jgi:callose synthase